MKLLPLLECFQLASAVSWGIFLSSRQSADSRGHKPSAPEAPASDSTAPVSSPDDAFPAASRAIADTLGLNALETATTHTTSSASTIDSSQDPSPAVQCSRLESLINEVWKEFGVLPIVVDTDGSSTIAGHTGTMMVTFSRMDGSRLIVNPKFASKFTNEELKYLLGHEAAHFANGDFSNPNWSHFAGLAFGLGLAGAILPFGLEASLLVKLPVAALVLGGATALSLFALKLSGRQQLSREYAADRTCVEVLDCRDTAIQVWQKIDRLYPTFKDHALATGQLTPQERISALESYEAAEL